MVANTGAEIGGTPKPGVSITLLPLVALSVDDLTISI
jgi:hypothetical protein